MFKNVYITAAAFETNMPVTHCLDVDFMIPETNKAFQIMIQELAINMNRKCLIIINLVHINKQIFEVQF